MNTFIATKNDEGRTLLKFLIKMLKGVPSSRIEKLFRKKDIKLNYKRTNNKKYILQEGDRIDVYGIFFDKPEERFAADITFKTVYEDEHILIANKKPGVVVHDANNCLDDQVLAYLNFVQTDSFKPSHIGRLDKVTSGMIIYGKTYKALRELKDVNSKFTKIYEFKSDLPNEITTKFKITHDEDYKRERCGDVGQTTTTIFTIKDGKKYAQLITGRKHQIRASLSKLGFPIVGDTRYGGKSARRVFLHSAYIKIDGLEGELEYLNGMEFWSEPVW